MSHDVDPVLRAVLHPDADRVDDVFPPSWRRELRDTEPTPQPDARPSRGSGRLVGTRTKLVVVLAMLAVVAGGAAARSLLQPATSPQRRWHAIRGRATARSL